jgi:hypothetical protein
MGSLLMQQGKLSDAESHFREALEGRRRVLGKEHPDTLVSKGNLDGLLARFGRSREAFEAESEDPP